jgi:hypothetical protein
MNSEVSMCRATPRAARRAARVTPLRAGPMRELTVFFSFAHPVETRMVQGDSVGGKK